MIELLVVLTISAILVAVAVPMFGASIARARVRDASNALLTAIELTRSEAIRRGNSVSLCRVGNPGAAVPACSAAAAAGFGANDWAIGWAIFEESAAAGTIGTIDAGDQVVLIQNPFAPGAAPARAALLEAGGPTVLTFTPSGVRAGGGALTFNARYPLAGVAQDNKMMNVTVMGKTTIN